MLMSSRIFCATGLALVSTALLSTACSSESNDAETLSIALAPASVSVGAGGSGTATATLTRGGAFNGVTTLTATGAPTGVTVAFTPVAIAAGASTSEVDLSVAATVAPGTYPVVVHATATGVTAATATLSVTVLSGDAHGFALAAAPATLTATAGGAATTSTITIARQAPFAGAVGFTVTGNPSGMIASVTPPSTPGASSTLSVAAGPTTVNGTYPLVVRGTSAGVADATTIVSITVTGGAAGGITLALAPAALSIIAGGATAPSTLTIARAGTFTGAVDVAVTGMPAGMTAVPDLPSVTGTTSTIVVGAAATVAPGSYSITVTATGAAIAATSITLPVVVTAPSTVGSITVSFCSEHAPLWLAVQDGSGAWTGLTPGTGNRYTFNFTSQKGGFAIVDTVGTTTELSVLYASIEELGSVVNVAGLSSCRTHALNGTIGGLASTETGLVSMGLSAQPVLANGPFTISKVATGRQNLVATRTDATTNSTNRVILRRGVNIANGGSIPTLDFGVEGIDPVTIGITVANLGADDAVLSSRLDNNSGAAPGALIGLIPSYRSAGTAPVSIAMVPGSQLTIEEQLVQAAVTGTTTSRTAGLYLFAPGGLPPTATISMGPALSVPTISKAATTPYIQPQLQLTSQAQYNRLVSVTYRSNSGTANMSITATEGYFGSRPATWTLTFPNLSTAAGWNNSWGIANGVAFDWSVTAQGGALALFDAPYFFDDTDTQSASQSSSAPVAARMMRTGFIAWSLSPVR